MIVASAGLQMREGSKEKQKKAECLMHEGMFSVGEASFRRCKMKGTESKSHLLVMRFSVD